MPNSRTDVTTIQVTRATLERLRELQRELQERELYRVTTGDTVAFAVSSASATMTTQAGDQRTEA